uniref:Uncharacterized protein n=1 Tax=Anguilla anguilla TaxID=7936 RepID=A0A0E9RDD3_ANGAN
MQSRTQKNVCLSHGLLQILLELHKLKKPTTEKGPHI